MKNHLLIAASAATLGWAMPAMAQEAASDASAAAPGEIIVTAERRAQSLQKLPTTASAITGEALANQQLQRVDDLVRATPSLSINDTGLGKFVNIRGVGKGADLPGIAPGVAYYVDGVPLPNQVFLETPFFDLARVEVLRGPQGTLVGMNSTGGAMLIVSQNPKYGVTEGSAEVSYGKFNDVRARGVINLGLSDKFGLRAIAEYENRDSFFTNVGPAKTTPGNVDRLSLRATLAGKLTDTVELFIRGEYNRNKSDGNPGKPIAGDPEPLYGFINTFSPADPFTLSRDITEKKDTEYGRISAELRVDVADAFQLRSITGYQKGSIRLVADLDATALPTARQQIDIDEPVVSQEVNLVSNPGGKIDWVLGAFYLHQDTNGFVQIADATSLHPAVEVVGRGRTRNYGIFGQGTFHASSALNVTLGLRYNNERHFQTRDGKTTVYTPVGPLVIPNATTEAKDEAVTGRLTVDYQISPDHFAYATVSRGFKGGGNNDAGAPFKAEKVWNYELGLKSSFVDRHIRTQAGLFYMDYQDIQAEVFNPVTTLSAVQNFAKAKIYGGEFQVQASAGALGLNASVAYTKSEIGKASLVDPRYGATTATDLTGRRLNFSPEWSFNAGLDYTVALGGGFTLTPRVQYSYLASQWASVFHVMPTDFIGSRSLVDANLVLTQADKGWRVELYGTNLTNETYVASKSVAAAGRPGRVQYYGAPRQFGVRVGYSF